MSRGSWCNSSWPSVHIWAPCHWACPMHIQMDVESNSCWEEAGTAFGLASRKQTSRDSILCGPKRPLPKWHESARHYHITWRLEPSKQALWAASDVMLASQTCGLTQSLMDVLEIYIYSCGVIIWSKFGGFKCYYLVQVCFLIKHRLSKNTVKIEVSALFFCKKKLRAKILNVIVWSKLTLFKTHPTWTR